ncbi:molecular chaperone [Zavarzinia sp.]|uniref:fimbrial biogenesis chaperone n=1 Tax=Zavarzinia sp. TaxID=2027920 RepID=UPI003567FD9C
MSRLWPALALAAVIGAATTVPAAASSIQVSPIRVELSADQPVLAVYVTNNGSNSLLVQASVESWTQVGGEDRHAPTRDVLVNPPQFRLAPGEKQILRYGLVNRQLGSGGIEASYRAFLQEIPETPPVGGATLQTVLRISIPVFIAPAGGAKPAGAWSSPAPGVLRYQNTGNVHLQLGKMRVVSGAKTLATIDVGGYVLAGQSHDWQLSGLGALPAGAHVVAESDAGAVDQSVTPP